MKDWLSSFFSGPNLLSTGLQLVGMKINADANKRAANIAQAGQRAQISAIQEGNRASQERLDAIEQQTAPASEYLRNVIAVDPNALTPSQNLALEDVRRESANRLAASGLRGAGRATTSALRKVEADFVGNAIDQNRRRADSAAGVLAGQGYSAAVRSAGVDDDTGRSVGQSYSDMGNTAAALESSTGDSQARVLGSIASIFASDAKEKERESRYARQGGRVTETS